VTRSKRGQTEKKNPGWFRKGHDARRHVFTNSDCRIGYWVVMLGLTPKTRDPAVREWVRLKACIHFSQKEKRNGQDESESVGAGRERDGRRSDGGKRPGDGSFAAVGGRG
jgi:hypothetical protein